MMALCMGMLVFAASCDNKKAETKAEPAKVEVEVITDSAFQQKAAGDYASLDQKTVITLNSDFTVTTKNYKKNYYKWELWYSHRVLKQTSCSQARVWIQISRIRQSSMLRKARS